MNINDYVSEITLCDWYVSETYDTTTLYFEAPKEIVNGTYPWAEFITISVEFPTGHPEAKDATVLYSPTIYDPEEDAFSDVDWTSVDIPYEDIEKLFEIADPMSVVWKR